MKKVMISAVVLCLCLGGVARAMDLEELLLGGPPKSPAVSAFEISSLDGGIPGPDPVSLLIGIGVGPDFDSPDNEFNLLFGVRYNLIEIGPKVYLWPNGDDHTAWGVYVLRHLSYDPVILGAATPFMGFETTVAGKDGDMYAFLSGVDVEVQPGIVIRTSAAFRSFDDALAKSHDGESDEVVAKLEFLYKF